MARLSSQESGGVVVDYRPRPAPPFRECRIADAPYDLAPGRRAVGREARRFRADALKRLGRDADAFRDATPRELAEALDDRGWLLSLGDGRGGYWSRDLDSGYADSV